MHDQKITQKCRRWHSPLYSISSLSSPCSDFSGQDPSSSHRCLTCPPHAVNFQDRTQVPNTYVFPVLPMQWIFRTGPKFPTQMSYLSSPCSEFSGQDPSSQHRCHTCPPLAVDFLGQDPASRHRWKDNILTCPPLAVNFQDRTRLPVTDEKVAQQSIPALCIRQFLMKTSAMSKNLSSKTYLH